MAGRLADTGKMGGDRRQCKWVSLGSRRVKGTASHGDPSTTTTTEMSAGNARTKLHGHYELKVVGVLFVEVENGVSRTAAPDAAHSVCVL